MCSNPRQIHCQSVHTHIHICKNLAVFVTCLHCNRIFILNSMTHEGVIGGHYVVNRDRHDGGYKLVVVHVHVCF